MLPTKLQFPTMLHQEVAEITATFFHEQAEVDTVLVTNSCARGVAIPQSDLDMNIYTRAETPPEALAALETQWVAFRSTHPVYQQFAQSGQFAYLHLDIGTQEFNPTVWDDGGGPDDFEVAVGNLVAYPAPLGAVGRRFKAVQAQWLPYYTEPLRQARLAMVREACQLDLSYIPFYVSRELYFQAFDRLYKAYREFLQGLFIAQRTYPIAYNKWIRTQVVDMLGLPDLYAELPTLLSISQFESPQLADKAAHLTRLVDNWLI